MNSVIPKHTPVQTVETGMEENGGKRETYNKTNPYTCRTHTERESADTADRQTDNDI